MCKSSHDPFCSQFSLITNRRNSMRAPKSLCALLLLAGPLTTQSFQLLEADSPIEVSDGGSIHFTRANGFSPTSPTTKWSTKINGSHNRELAIYGCTPPTACDASLSRGRWVVTLYDTTNAPMTTLTHPGQGGTNYVDIEITPTAISSGSSFSMPTMELVQSNARLDHITVSVNGGSPKIYPVSPSTCPSPCKISIYRN